MNSLKIREILSNKIVGIAGCGGLGSNCAVALARIGIGKLIIADFDIIDESNLNRQYYFRHQIGEPKVHALRDNIHSIDSKIQIETHQIEIKKDNIVDLFAKVDVLIEAFDKKEMKQMLIEVQQKHLSHIPLIIGNGMAGYGNNNQICTRQIDNLYICGDMENEIGEENPPLAPKVCIVANMQANQALELLLKM